MMSSVVMSSGEAISSSMVAMPERRTVVVGTVVAG
jgi:hypothetical protein